MPAGPTAGNIAQAAFNAGGCLAKAGSNAVGLPEPGHIVESL